ncbi:ABC transporter substrate-binding protein [Umezawaea beigongshangensis]|uniref:ABC transporter substrate-binding protein n=1 Tax=Umezawaea beigongshangensis TaxID=2780383 RepID=UPI0027DAF504|nr:ABC transporter substrate-binding protein [Umezawaea beigongshangensis]
MQSAQTWSRRIAATTALTALVLSGCATREQDATPGSATGAAPASAFPVELTAPGGERLVLDRAPQRIVSLAPTSTESLFAIGAGAQVVAVDDRSTYPENAPRTDLSGFQPNVEAVAGHTPDLVVASNDTEGLVAGLAKVDVPVLLLPAATDLDDVHEQISLLGRATGHTAEADDLVRTMRADVEKIVADTPRPAEPLSYYHELDPSFYTATSATFIGRVYGLFGLTNVADAASVTGDYPQLSAEQVVQADPDLIFLADVACCGQSAETVAQRPGWASVTAVREGGVVALDDDVASRWGPRVVDLVRTVADAVAASAAK